MKKDSFKKTQGQQSYLELLSTQIREAMQMQQRRETDRRKLRETKSKILKTGFSHARKDW